MSTKEITSELADGLRSLAESQLQIQASRSAALDAGALGVVSVDVAVAALILTARPAHHLWIVALILLALSLGLAVHTLLLTGTQETGPLVAYVLAERETRDDDILEESLLEDLAANTLANTQTLAHRGSLFSRALVLLVLTIVVELAGRLH